MRRDWNIGLAGRRAVIHPLVVFNSPVVAGFQFADRQFRRHRPYVCKELPADSVARSGVGLINCRDDASRAPLYANLVPNPV